MTPWLSWLSDEPKVWHQLYARHILLREEGSVKIHICYIITFEHCMSFWKFPCFQCIWFELNVECYLFALSWRRSVGKLMQDIYINCPLCCMYTYLHPALWLSNGKRIPLCSHVSKRDDLLTPWLSMSGIADMTNIHMVDTWCSPHVHIYTLSHMQWTILTTCLHSHANE